MFSIKKYRNSFVTKSVIPTNLSIKQHIAAKIAEKKRNQEQPLVGNSLPVPNAVAFDVGTFATEQEAKDALWQLFHTDKKIDVKQYCDEYLKLCQHFSPTHANDELDITALKSQKNFAIETTAKGIKYSRHSNNAIVLPTGCPTARIQSVIGQKNMERMNAGKEPFYNYQQWNDALKAESAQRVADDIAKGFVYINSSQQQNVSNSVASYIVAQNYYLLRDAGTTYVLNTQDANPRALRLMKDTEHSFGGDNSNNIRGDTKAHPMVSLSDTEHADIIKAKPTYAELMQVYVQAQNLDNLTINFGTAVRIW
jgi:hypothetical protein